jgi:predicted nucleotidyltransferase
LFDFFTNLFATTKLGTSSDIEPFIKDLVHWAESQSGLLAIALVGSYARAAANALSDIDLILIARAPEKFVQETTWASAFGPIEKQQIEHYGKVNSLRVWYSAGPEVEFGLTTQEWLSLPLDAGTKRVISDGIKVVFEREAQIIPRRI